jgi:hypothetical protein
LQPDDAAVGDIPQKPCDAEIA